MILVCDSVYNSLNDIIRHKKLLIYGKNKESSTLNDVTVINKMIKGGVEFKHQKAEVWHDTGSVKGLLNARKSFHSRILNLQKPTNHQLTVCLH